jgi:AraC family transcriptional regulator
MAATPDHFRAFVDAVVASLDAPARTAHVAARLHISRSQLDRVVSAAAGEAPAQLQRRILLERAAFRLLERNLRVLEVALEAGYASHEAFTRAFRRAYGSTPSVWRAGSGPIHLDAPNRIHFHPPGGLRLPAQREVTSVDLILSMTEHHIWLVGQLLERAARLDDAQLDAAIELSVEGIDDNPTLRTVLSRLVDQMEIWNAAVANQPYDFAVKRTESLNSMRDRLAGAGPVFLGHVRSAGTKGQFDDTFVDSTSGTPLFFTYGGMIAHVLTYAAHRRTLATGALYSAGITDLEDDPLAWEPVRPVGRPTSP